MRPRPRAAIGWWSGSASRDGVFCRGHQAIIAGMNTTLPLCLIAAVADNAVIGCNNQLPWHLPADLKHFKARTLGKPIIMGRKTWDSLGRPLPGRLNLVVSRQADLHLDGAEVFASLEAAILRADEWARAQGVDELMLIGGAQLYEQALAQAEHMAGDMVHHTALSQMLLDIGAQLAQRLGAANHRRVAGKQLLIHLGQ